MVPHVVVARWNRAEMQFDIGTRASGVAIVQVRLVNRF
jgi:hypothetical protein